MIPLAAALLLAQTPGSASVWADYSQRVPRDVVWESDSKAFSYQIGEVRMRFDLASRTSTPTNAGPVRPSRRDPPGRAVTVRQGEIFVDGRQITNDADPSRGRTNGEVPWVYQEEWEQRAGFGLSPNGQYLWHFHFDVSPVQPVPFLSGVTRTRPQPRTHVFPFAGEPNPKVELRVTDLSTGQAVTLDRAPHADAEYLFDVEWTGANQLVYQRSDRLHRLREVMHFRVGDARPSLWHVERAEGGYVPYRWSPHGPSCRDTGTKFFHTEKGGWYQLASIDPATGMVSVLTGASFDARLRRILHVSRDSVWYEASSPTRPLATQVMRLDRRTGTASRVTDPELGHQAWVSPDGAWVVVRASAPDRPDRLDLFDRRGRRAEVVPPLTPMDWTKPEVFTFTSADGAFPLAGTLRFPRQMSPHRRYPVVFQVYLGPEFNDVDWAYRPPAWLNDHGFIVAEIEARGGLWRGAAFRRALAGQLGIAEVDDLAAAARALAARPDVDRSRVGVFGTSYGGYVSLMALARYPELFRAASAGSPVTDWRLYDTIYTERYMGLPSEQKHAYDASSVLTHAGGIRGDLQLFFGTADFNVHPTHSLRLIEALRRRNFPFELIIGPDEGHSSPRRTEVLRFFQRSLGPQAANPSD